MNFEAQKSKKSISERAGYLLIYLLSSILLYFFLKLVDKLPKGWSFVHILILTTSLLILSRILQRVIK